MCLAREVTVPAIKRQEGDVIHLELPEPEPLAIEPENIPLDILYEDADLLVVNKPKGMVVHPAAGHYSGTLVNAVLYHCGVLYPESMVYCVPESYIALIRIRPDL